MPRIAHLEDDSRLLPHFTEALRTGFIQDANGSVAVRTVFTGWTGLDSIVGSRMVLAFTPSLADIEFDASIPSQSGRTGRLQMITFLADLTPVITIWIIESHRRGNYWTPATVPFIFGVFYQIFDIGLVAPVYYFLHYVLLSSANYHARDNRLVRTSYAKTLIPTLAIGYILPTIAMYNSSFELNPRQSWNYAWQFFPLWITLLHRLLASFIKDTTDEDKINNVTADLSYL
jgi:hypothetical protein